MTSRSAENLVVFLGTTISSFLVMLIPMLSYSLYGNHSIQYFHLYLGFRVIAIVFAPLVALGTILLIRRSVPETPGPLRAAAVAITTAAVTPPVVAAIIGMRALVPGATPLAGSVLELMTIVAMGGLLYWSPPALAIMGPLLVGAAWWLRGSSQV